MNEKYEKIYRRVERGLYDQVVFIPEKGTVYRVSVKKLKDACLKQAVDFDSFLEYARKRKAEEMKK
jgi:hypothetical protein